MSKKIDIVLLSCVAKKLDGTHPAHILYSKSDLFKKSFDYTVQVVKPKGIFILSAKLHLINFKEKISKYDKTLNKMGKKEKEEWATEVVKQLRDTFEIKGRKLEDYNFIILAGKNYYEGLLEYLPNYEIPLGKLKVGERLSILGKATIQNKIIKDGEI